MSSTILNGFRKVVRAAFYGVLAVLVALGVSDFWVEQVAESKIYEKVSEVPQMITGLVLGTSKTTRNGGANPYFVYRINAAVQLYKSGKVKYLIVSGDNSRKGYDESTDMKNALIERGVPEDVIYLDYAGFRTLDSVVRCKSIFDQDEFLVISQKFHNERAIYLARYNGLRAIGYCAKDVGNTYGMVVHIREKLARVNAVMDILVNKKPHFGGPKIEICYDH